MGVARRTMALASEPRFQPELCSRVASGDRPGDYRKSEVSVAQAGHVAKLG